MSMQPFVPFKFDSGSTLIGIGILCVLLGVVDMRHGYTVSYIINNYGNFVIQEYGIGILAVTIPLTGMYMILKILKDMEPLFSGNVFTLMCLMAIALLVVLYIAIDNGMIKV